ncbi:MAG: hypothetical protein GY928_13260 [Colwellia sp.]|nr:hypothetical protein [Colwellia sp.]
MSASFDHSLFDSQFAPVLDVIKTLQKENASLRSKIEQQTFEHAQAKIIYLKQMHAMQQRIHEERQQRRIAEFKVKLYKKDNGNQNDKWIERSRVDNETGNDNDRSRLGYGNGNGNVPRNVNDNDFSPLLNTVYWRSGNVNDNNYGNDNVTENVTENVTHNRNGNDNHNENDYGRKRHAKDYMQKDCQWQ